MPTVAVFFLVAMHLVFHFVEGFVECCAGILAFDVSNNGVIALNFHDKFDVNPGAFEFEGHIDFTDGIEVTDQLFSFLGDVVSEFLLDAAVAACD